MSTHKVVAGVLVGSMVPSAPPRKQAPKFFVIFTQENAEHAAMIGDVAGWMYIAMQKLIREKVLQQGQGESAAEPSEPALLTAENEAVIAALITGGMLPCFPLPPLGCRITGYSDEDLRPATELVEDSVTLYGRVYRTLMMMKQGNPETLIGENS